ncbi:MFS general substrate transporter [Punctularia strigosozonata HHB-11173 SS5]|uniref:MFS general substrate transporter n=1 Tax=Punctularia strigosozonata (strain HHB-11173) TaxID=741275 RepID=R7S1B2_PUNST|nr:MFS general substrate transporter [Punctularia strigosozonata HHB-11173 SS5]EIN04013.1 MFS general substrate transporter [Punctularia strigosozonata HHB-11173 SS5]
MRRHENAHARSREHALPFGRLQPSFLRLSSTIRSSARSVAAEPTSEAQEDTSRTVDEFKLPRMSCLCTMILCNVFLQLSFFVVVSSSNEYAKHLGGTSTFSGVVIGIPTAVSGLALLPIMKYDRNGYKIPLHIACASAILGHILYALAYKTNFLYLILIGRMVNGIAFTSFMYTKKYCSDSRVVGIRRRTTLASWLVMGQGVGMTLGPFAGGLLFKIGFANPIFNGFTSPAWIMAIVWLGFWIFSAVFFEDPPAPATRATPLSPLPAPQEDPSVPPSTDVSTAALIPEDDDTHRMTPGRWGVCVCMCWFAMTCFFVLGAWEANLPVFGAASPTFRWTAFGAGNFIALGGICTFPFLLLNLLVARRIQDRKLLLFGTSVGFAGLAIFLALLNTGAVRYGSLFVCWFAVALGFNLASTVTLSLLSKQLPPEWNGRTSLAIQYSNYTGRVTGAIWGGSGVAVGMSNYVGLEIAIVGIGAALFLTFWRSLKAKTG